MSKLPDAPRSAANRSLRLGTRGSALAQWQAHWVASQLAARGVVTELVLITTQGDVTSGSLGQAGGIGLFTKEIQRALLDQRVDLAVHSLKDLPTEPVAGLRLAAVPPREAVHDALIGPADPSRAPASGWTSLAALPRAARVGTGSIRRRAQLLHLRPDLEVLDIRGNVETRLRKLDEGQYDAIVLAEAGLRRLGLEQRISCRLGPPVLFPAVGQGALGIEIRADDEPTARLISPLDFPADHASVIAERAMLRRLRGGCLAPVGAWGRTVDQHLWLDGVVLSPDGQQRVEVQVDGSPADAALLGENAADQLLAQGAAELIARPR